MTNKSPSTAPDWRIVEEIECPSCGAPKGSWCVENPSGRHIHGARLMAHFEFPYEERYRSDRSVNVRGNSG